MLGPAASAPAICTPSSVAILVLIIKNFHHGHVHIG
jgi:hypothetical protein